MRADYYTVAVRTGGPGAGGVSLLLIEREREGFARTKLKKMGWWASDTAQLFFDNVRVPVDNLIGPENKGFIGIMLNFNQERLGMSAGAWGYAKVCLDEAIAYARERHTFGKPLIANQVVRHRLVDMQTRVHAARALLYDTAWRLVEAPREPAHVAQLAMLKNLATDTMQECADAAVQVQFVARPPIDPGRVIELIQKHRNYRLAGQDRLRVTADLLGLTERQPPFCPPLLPGRPGHPEPRSHLRPGPHLPRRQGARGAGGRRAGQRAHPHRRPVPARLSAPPPAQARRGPAGAALPHRGPPALLPGHPRSLLRRGRAAPRASQRRRPREPAGGGGGGPQLQGAQEVEPQPGRRVDRDPDRPGRLDPEGAGILSDLYFQQLPVGQMANLAYLIGSLSTRQVLLVDPAWSVDALLDRAEADGMTPVGALVTHYHQDHVGGSIFGMQIEGVNRLLERQPMPLHVNRHEAEGLLRVTGEIGRAHV